MANTFLDTTGTRIKRRSSLDRVMQTVLVSAGSLRYADILMACRRALYYSNTVVHKMEDMGWDWIANALAYFGSSANGYLYLNGS
jgi:aspartokinase-like uncharacterized kinase